MSLYRFVECRVLIKAGVFRGTVNPTQGQRIGNSRSLREQVTNGNSVSVRMLGISAGGIVQPNFLSLDKLKDGSRSFVVELAMKVSFARTGRLLWRSE